MSYLPNNEDLKHLMLADSRIILKSIDWTEIEINKKLLELEQAIDNYNYELAESIKNQILNLNRRLNRELKNMDGYMVKYRKLIQNEKEALLSDFGKKK